MRDDVHTMLKQTKQQINALCLRHGKIFNGKCRWTKGHIQWLRKVEFTNAVVREALDEYLITLDQLSDKVERLDKRIKTHTAMSLIVETSDFRRFPHASLQFRFLPQAFHYQSRQLPSAPPGKP